MNRDGGSDDLGEADDRTLAGRAADGDVEAFEVIVARWGPLMRGYARRILGAGGEADDAVQEAFLTAWQRVGDVRDGSVLKSWLMRIVVRRCTDLLRARHVADDIDDHDPPARPDLDPAAQVQAQSAREALDHALERLPELQRRCWVLRELTGAGYEQISRDLSVPVSTVRGALARARAHLVVELEGWR